MVPKVLRPPTSRVPPLPGRAVVQRVLSGLGALLLGAVSLPALALDAPRLPPSESTALPLREAQTIAVQRSKALLAQDAAAESARQRAVAAAQRPDPVLRVGLDNVPVEGGSTSWLTREPTTARSIGLVQALPDATKRSARAAVYEREAEQALAQRALATRSAARDAGLAWLGLHAALQRLQVIDAQRVEATLVREATEAAYRAGRGSQSDVFAARTALVRLDDQQLQSESQRDLARIGLHRWIGEAADRPLAEAPALDRLSAGQVPDADPELQVSRARERRASAAAVLAREERRADWSVDLRFQQRGPRFDNMVTLGFSLPLRWDLANRQERELSARLAQQRQAESDSVEVRRARDADLERWHQRWRIGLARLALNGEQMQPLAQDRVQAALAAYRAGSGSLQTVLEARQAALALQLERVQIELDVANDWLRLETLTFEPSLTALALQEKTR